MIWRVLGAVLPPALYMFLLYKKQKEVIALRAQVTSLVRTCDAFKETCRKHVVLIDAQYAQLQGCSAEEVQRIMDRIEEEDDKRRLN